MQFSSSRAPADSPDRPPDLPSIQQQQQQLLLNQQQPASQQPLQPLQPQQPPLPPLAAGGAGGAVGPVGAGTAGVGAAGVGGGAGGWPAVVEMRELGAVHAATIPPLTFWNSEFRNKQPAFIRFNLTLPWGANFAVYGRRNVGPSVTQHDFVEFIKAGRLDHRARRSLDHVAAFVSSHSYDGDREYVEPDDSVAPRASSAVSFMIPIGNGSDKVSRCLPDRTRVTASEILQS